MLILRTQPKEAAMRSMLLLSVLMCSVTCVNSFSPALQMPSKLLNESQEVDRIALGSRYDQASAEGILTMVQQTEPDVFLFVGDNVYASDE